MSFGSNTKVNKDYNKLCMRKYKQTQDFNRYMYMYNLFVQNYKLNQQLNKQLNQVQSIQELPNQIQQSNQRQKQYIQSINDSVDTNIINAVLILHILNGDIIMVKEMSSMSWMLPVASLVQNETPLNAAIRKFNEETSYIIDKSKLQLPIEYHDSIYLNNLTRFFKVKTTQVFGSIDPNKINNISINKIKLNIPNANYFNIHNLKSFSNLFNIGFI